MPERSTPHEHLHHDPAPARFVTESLAVQDELLQSTVQEEAQQSGLPDLLVLARRLAMTEYAASLKPPHAYPHRPDRFRRDVEVLTYASEIARFNEALAQQVDYAAQELPDANLGALYDLPSLHPYTTASSLHESLKVSHRALIEPLGAEHALPVAGVPTSAQQQEAVGQFVSAAHVNARRVPEWLPLDSLSLAPATIFSRIDAHGQRIARQLARPHDIVRFVGDVPQPGRPV